MGKYVEKNLNNNEQIVKNAELNGIVLFWSWFWGILFCWVLLIPTIKAIAKTIAFKNIELALTNKRLIGKKGFVHRETLDIPLNKVESIHVEQSLWGRMFHYGEIHISTSGFTNLYFEMVKNPDDFKRMCMNEIDTYEAERLKKQNMEATQALAIAMTKNNEKSEDAE